MEENANYPTWCPHEGPRIAVDADGCCAECGCDAMGQGVDQALQALDDAEGLRAEVERLCTDRDNMYQACRRQQDEVVQLEAAIRDFADDMLGLQEAADPDELLSRVAKHGFELRAEVERQDECLTGWIAWARDESRAGWQDDHPLLRMSKELGLYIPPVKADRYREWLAGHGGTEFHW